MIICFNISFSIQINKAYKQKLKLSRYFILSLQSGDLTDRLSKKKNNTWGLLEKCSVMEALNRHARFILESPIIPLNAYPFVY